MNESKPERGYFPTFKRLFTWRLTRAGLFLLACLVTLIGVLYAVENWRGSRARRALNRELAAKGALQEWNEFVPPPVPDEQNFAMTPFLAPLFDYKKDLRPSENKYHVRDTNSYHRTMSFAQELKVSFRGFWRVGAMTDLAAWQTNLARLGGQTNQPSEAASDRAVAGRAVLKALEPYGPVLDELRAASRKPQSRFNIRYDEENLWAIQLPHLGVLNKTSQVLQVRAAAELALGQTDAALSDILLVCDLADAIRNEPFLITQVIRIAELQFALQSVWEGIVQRRWSEAQLQVIQSRLQRFDLLASLKRALETERFAGNWTVDQLRNGNRVLLGEALGHGGPNFFFRLCPRGWFDLEKLNYNRLFERAFSPAFNADARRVYPKAADDSSREIEASFKDRRSVVWQHRIVARLLLPAITSALQKSALAQNGFDLAVVACALERYRLANGRYPDTLAALVPQFVVVLPHDIVNGDPFKYRRSDDGNYLLYSVGWNEKDDGGTVARVGKSAGKVQDVTQGDWVWWTSTDSK